MSGWWRVREKRGHGKRQAGEGQSHGASNQVAGPRSPSAPEHSGFEPDASAYPTAGIPGVLRSIDSAPLSANGLDPARVCLHDPADRGRNHP